MLPTVPYIMNVLLCVMHILNAHSAYSSTLHRFMSPIQTHEHYIVHSPLFYRHATTILDTPPYRQRGTMQT